MSRLLEALRTGSPLPTSGASTAGLHPVFAAALAPLFMKPAPGSDEDLSRPWQNWVMVDADGKAMWVVYAPSREDALLSYSHPRAVDARPQTPEDAALSQRVRDSYGTGGT